MRVDLNGKVALVTGAGGAIGRSIALTLAANGARVVVNDALPSGTQTVDEIRAAGGDALFLQADITSSAAVRQMAADAERHYGRIDILVNNAGVNTPGHSRRPVHEYEEAEWHRVIDCDLHGTFYCTRAISPGMVDRKHGVIVNIASVMGVVPIRQQIAFAAAKAAVIHFSRSAALELAPFGVRVVALAPGSILTPATQALFYNPENQAMAQSLLQHIPMARAGETHEIADTVLFLVSPEASYITGALFVADGGWTAGFARDW